MTPQTPDIQKELVPVTIKGLLKGEKAAPKSMLSLRNAFILFFLLVGPVYAENPQIVDGFYAVDDSGQGLAVKILDGSEVKLGERFTEPVGKISFTSTSNDNESYSLSLEKDTPYIKDPHGLFVLCTQGHCVKFGGGTGAEGDKITSYQMYGNFTSAKAAEAFAKFLNVQPVLRKHPQHELLVKFVPAKKIFSADETIPVILQITNVGSNPVNFFVGGQNRGDRDNQFGFTAYGLKAVPDTGDPNHFGGLGSTQTLNPGETFTKEADLKKWFNFPADTYDQTYTILGTYYLLFSESENFQKNALWEDFAAAGFELAIKAKN